MLLESGNKCLSNNCTQIRFVYFLKCATWVTIKELQKLHIKNMKKNPGKVVHAINPALRRQRASRSLGAILVHIVCPR